MADLRYHFLPAGSAPHTAQMGEVNSSLWTTVFCNATSQDHCLLCLSLNHTQANCPDKPQSSEATSPPKSQQKQAADHQVASPRPICIHYNSKGCNSASCTYRHICLECHGNHRQSTCPSSYRYRPDDRKKRGVPERSFRARQTEDRAKQD